MTQTVDSKAWFATMQIKALNLQDTIAPPQRISTEELLSHVAELLQPEQEAVPAEQTWLDADPQALGSVLRGLSQEARIDRGSFAAYAE